jgi:hypothetical protein
VRRRGPALDARPLRVTRGPIHGREQDQGTPVGAG